MNICFLMGKIISSIEFDFLLNSKNNSIVRFTLKVDENCILTVKAYDEIAEWCYQNLIKNNVIAIQGELDNNMEIIINNVECY